MQLKPRITFRDIPHSAALETHILQKINKLNQFHGRIMHCDVVIEQIQKHKRQGKLYHVNINLTLPGGIEIVVNKPRHKPEYADAYVAIRDAFNAARRRLQAATTKMRMDVKTHDVVHHGYVSRFNEKEGFGFIEANGNEYYFSTENVTFATNGDLKPGARVHFIPAVANYGMQANRVSVEKDRAA
ncbi:MAG: ribosome-associated translation inhibitor RaiA [Gammaproteobacteria bacterium]